MHSLTVLYPNKEGAKFDFEYYVDKHIPFANGLLGHEFKVTKGIASAQGGPPAFLCTARMEIGTTEEFLPVLIQHVAALQNDIPNYTNIVPVIQFEELL
ncbi:MAG TPA: EthD family reductase [Candidatus Limnocylindrales bacterium]|nr:EthD family reductase [Candidatus Limnocylindrales bacterium]